MKDIDEKAFLDTLKQVDDAMITATLAAKKFDMSMSTYYRKAKHIKTNRDPATEGPVHRKRQISGYIDSRKTP